MNKKTVYWILLVMVIIIFQELVFRICFPLPELSNFNRSSYIPRPSSVTQIPPMRFEKRTFQSYPDTIYNFVHELNGYGFRDSEWKVNKSPEQRRIMFIGDSFLEGAMAIEGQTITDYFNRTAFDQNTQTMNLGIIGAGLREYINVINDAIPIFKPDLTVLVLFSNDISNRTVGVPGEPIAPDKFSDATPRIYYLLRMLLRNEQLPFRWKNETSFAPPVPHPLNLWTTGEAEYSKHVTPEMATHMKAGNYNTFRINYAAAEEKYLKDTVKLLPYFRWINDYVKNHGSRLAVCYIPSRSQVTSKYYEFEKESCQLLCPPELDLTGGQYNIHQQALMETFHALGVPFYDFTYKVKLKESQGQKLYWDYDDHMNNMGYHLIGTTLRNWWETTLK